MKKLTGILTALVILCSAVNAWAVPATTVVTGIVYGGGGLPAPNTVVIFNTPQQIAGGEVITRSIVSTRTNASGVISPITLVQATVVQITVGSGFPVTGIVPLAATAPFSAVLAGSVFSGGTFQVNGINTTSQAAINWQNGTNITVSNPSAGNVKFDLSGTIAVANGGTGRTSLTAHSVLVGAGTSGLAQIGPGTTNFCFIGQGASADPVFAECPGPATSGTVTSVDWSLPNIFNVSGNPISTTGTLTATLANQSANTVFSGPTTGGAATPAFRALVAADIPNLDTSKLTTGMLAVARGGTGASSFTAHGVLIGNGTGVTAATSPGTSGQVLTSNGASADPTYQTFSGVTSVGLSLPTSVFTLSGTPVTTTGVLTGVFANQTQNKVFASPNGSTGVPSFRALVAGDMPASGISATLDLALPTCGRTGTTQMVFNNGFLTGHSDFTADPC